MSSYAVLTGALHEHAYIDAFISHYRNLGFRKIYIVADKHQPPYEPYITAQEGMTITIIEMEYPDSHAANFEKIQEEYYKRAIRAIPEEWILLCDVDEFLYLNGFDSIGKYLEQFPPSSNIHQISFPWLMVEHLGDEPDNIFQMMDGAKWCKNNFVKSIFRKSKILGDRMGNFEVSTHGVAVAGLTYIQNGFHRSRHPVGNIQGRYTDRNFHYQNHSFMIHFHTRSFRNVVIKILTNKYLEKANGNERRKLIQTMKNKIYNYLSIKKFNLIIDHQSYPEIATFPLTSLNRELLPIRKEYNHQFFDHLLQKHQLENSHSIYFQTIFQNPNIVIGKS